jgi:hypothetical protein
MVRPSIARSTPSKTQPAAAVAAAKEPGLTTVSGVRFAGSVKRSMIDDRAAT